MTAQNKQAESILRNPYQLIREKVEFGDLFVLIYTLVLVRQYLWVIQNNSLAWTLSVPVAAICWYVYLSQKQFAAAKLDPTFWLIVGLPLLALYLLRAAFPDHSFDVLNYHLLHTERTLRGTLFQSGDFFPSAIPLNPIPDTVTGLSRLLLGFRLGTVINLFALIASAQIVGQLLQPLINSRWLRSLAVVLVFLSENLLFEIGTYLVDLLALPLLLQATLLTLKAREANNRLANYVQVAFLLGISVAFKLTNLAVAMPLLAICVYQMLVDTRPVAKAVKRLFTVGLVMSVAFLAPLVPFTVYIYRVTGNPVFPVANGFFQSPYWPTHGGWDNRFGPLTLWEAVVWPFMIWFVPERQSELAVYSGRISLAFGVALVALAFVWRKEWTRYLCLIAITSLWLWSFAATGNGRYGFYQETLAGVIVVAVVATLLRGKSLTKVSFRPALGGVLVLVLIAQAILAVSYFLNREWGGRLTLLVNTNGYAQEAKLFFKDRSLTSFLTDQDRTRFDKVQVWFETAPTSTGLEVLLKPDVPIIALRQAEYFLTRDAWRQFIQKVLATNRQGMYTLCNNTEETEAKQAITKRGLEVGEIVNIDLPFFSFRDRIGLVLIEVRLPQDREARERFESAWMKAAFASADYSEQIVAINPPTVMRPGEKIDMQFKVKNLGKETWPATGDKDYRYLIDMGNRWIRNGIVSEDSRALLGSDLPPGGETEMKMRVTAPSTPGEYTLEIDMVHEGVSWFKERGAKPLQLRVRVQP